MSTNFEQEVRLIQQRISELVGEARKFPVDDETRHSALQSLNNANNELDWALHYFQVDAKKDKQ